MRAAAALRLADLVHPELLALVDDLLRLAGGWKFADVAHETLFTLTQRVLLELPGKTGVTAADPAFPVLGGPIPDHDLSAVRAYCEEISPPGTFDPPPGQTVFAFLRHRFRPLVSPRSPRPRAARREAIVRQRRRNRG